MNLDWHFLLGGSGRISAASMADPLKNTHLKPEELLVREALQNSIDETITNGTGLTFKIQARRLSGQAKAKFVEGLQLRQLQQNASLFESNNNWFRKGHECLENLDDLNKPIRILEISDHNANGLGGKWNLGQSIQDRFFNLVLSITKTKKQEESSASQLGSYGFGKMVFALSSNLRTMVYYSHFPQAERSGDANRRLLATSFLPNFFDEAKELEYTGQAYFGIDSDQDNNPKKPLVNGAADSFFEKLGFSKRTQGDFGTTVIVPDCDFKISDLGKAIEKWWWPLLIDGEFKDKLEIELIEDDGTRYEINPEQREDLHPFIMASNNCKENFSKIKKADTKKININATGTDGRRSVRHPGMLSSLRLNKSSEIEHKNCIALIRDNLVIEYWDRAFREEGHAAVAVFYTTDKDKEAKKIITFAEPPAHDKINENHTRLTEQFGNVGSDFVRLTKGQISEKCRDFQTGLDKIESNKDSDALSFLDDMLGPLIKPRKKGKPPPPQPDPRAISLQKKSRTLSEAGKTFSELSFEIALIDEIETQQMEFEMTIACAVLADDVKRTDKRLKVFLDTEAHHTPIILEPGQSQTIILTKGEKFTGTAKSEIYPEWVISWGLKIDKSEASE